jgi:hypothetical protein
MYTAVFDGWLLEANIFIWAKKKQSHNISSQKPFTAALLCGHHHRSPFQGKKSANRPDASGAGKKEKKREQNQSREVTMVRWIYYLCDIIIQRQRTK